MNDECVIEETKKNIKKFLELKKRKTQHNKTYDRMKVIIRWKVIALIAQMKKKIKETSSNEIIHFKILGANMHRHI